MKLFNIYKKENKNKQGETFSYFITKMNNGLYCRVVFCKSCTTIPTNDGKIEVLEKNCNVYKDETTGYYKLFIKEVENYTPFVSTNIEQYFN